MNKVQLTNVFSSTNDLSNNFDNISIPDVNDPDVFDPFCDPENPIRVKFEDISLAEYKIRNSVICTPCEKSKLSDSLGIEIYFKKEFRHHTGSFKERGARNALLGLNEEQKTLGVIAASAGNHALALSYHGRDLKIPVTVVMPTTAALMKINNCRILGAEVLLIGKSIIEAKLVAIKMGKTRNLVYINGYDHPDVLAGQGTMALQVIEQVPDVDAMIIPVGGGGLIAGIAVALKTLNKDILVYGVESEKCPSFQNAIASGKPVFTETQTSVADGLAVSMVGVNAFHTAQGLIDKMITVEEDFIALAILRLLEEEKIVIEGAGAACLAPILSDKVPELKGKKVVLPLCGGNIDTTVLGRCIDRGLAFLGRLSKFIVIVPDCTGSIATLSTFMADQGVSIKDIFHERSWLTSDIFNVQVRCVCETRDHEHAMAFKNALFEKYKRISWGPHVI